MEKMQSKALPKNWLKLVQEFDISRSTLSDNSKEIAMHLKPIILEGEKSLCSPLLKYLVKFIVDNTDFLEHYKNVPLTIIQDACNEINSERGVNLTRKLNSLFMEFLTYQDLYEKGYDIVASKREQGSCDLIMHKDNHIYNIEVKLKESQDIGISRLYDYIDGCSLLEKNGFLRGKFFEIHLKVDNLTDSNVNDLLGEIDIFIEQQQDIYDGEKLQIFTHEKRNKLNRNVNQLAQYSNSFIINTVEDVERLINEIFVDNNGHLTKLINKSTRYSSDENFTGCLIWSIPFHMEIANDKIKKAFKKLSLDFDLFVYVTGHRNTPFNFFIAKNNSSI